jgi:hypothetical protein
MWWLLVPAFLGYLVFRKPTIKNLPPVPHGDPFYTNLEKETRRIRVAQPKG